MKETASKESMLVSLYKEANKLGYEVESVAGFNGKTYYWKNVIELGRDSSLENRVVILYHEIGHVKDYQLNPPDAEEIILMAGFSEQYQLGDKYYKREQSAWNFAGALIKSLDSWDEIETEFLSYKEEALAAYYKRHLKAKEQGKDKPEQVLFDKVYKEAVK